jgi:hypothetical protein
MLRDKEPKRRNTMSEQSTAKTVTTLTIGGNDLAASRATVSSSALADLTEPIAAIPLDDVRRLGVSVPQAVAVCRHYARCYAEDRPAFAEALNPCVFDPMSHDNLEARAEALWEADMLLTKILEHDSEAATTAESARTVKKRLLRTAEYLWGDDTQKMEQVSNAKSGYSHMDLADSIFTLYHLFVDNWDEVAKRSDVTQEEIKNARDVGNRLLDAIGPSRDEKIKAAQELREQAGEYARRGIEDIRTAAGFVFRNDEKRLLRYPALGSMRKRSKADAQNGSEDVADEPAALPATVPAAAATPAPAV